MPTRLASILAIIAFAMCLVVGGFDAGNTFSTTVSRALAAMAGTFVIGLLIGWMAQKMIAELGPARRWRRSQTKKCRSRPARADNSTWRV